MGKKKSLSRGLEKLRRPWLERKLRKLNKKDSRNLKMKLKPRKKQN